MTQKLMQEITALTQKLIESYSPDKIILFGSHATGEATIESDLDLFIIKKTTKPYFERLQDVNRLLQTDRLTDIIILTPEELAKAVADKRLFIRHIFKYGKTLYESHLQSS